MLDKETEQRYTAGSIASYYPPDMSDKITALDYELPAQYQRRLPGYRQETFKEVLQPGDEEGQSSLAVSLVGTSTRLGLDARPSTVGIVDFRRLVAMEGIDEDKRKEFEELQSGFVDVSNKLGQLKQQVRIKDGERQRAKLTKTELEGLPDDVTLYRALGRSFVMAPKPVLMQEIDEAQAGCQEDVDTLKKNIHYCEKKAGELDQQLRELLTHTPALAAALAGASS
eukprot:jgi/Pico_ML_1/54309/g4677.t1